MRARLPLAVLVVLGACTPQGDPSIGPEGFEDDFDREHLGDVWNDTGGGWRLEDGAVVGKGARNRPLWLRRTLPRDVRISFDARSDSPEGDIKFELFGDGVSRAQAESYVATGYVVIFGGWGNSLNVLARLDEHGEDRVVGPRRRVEPGRTYRFVTERRGSEIVVTVDGEPLLRMDDPDPLHGRGHDHFAFNDWDAELTFDDLRIEPL